MRNPTSSFRLQTSSQRIFVNCKRLDWQKCTLGWHAMCPQHGKDPHGRNCARIPSLQICPKNWARCLVSPAIKWHWQLNQSLSDLHNFPQSSTNLHRPQRPPQPLFKHPYHNPPQTLNNPLQLPATKANSPHTSTALQYPPLCSRTLHTPSQISTTCSNLQQPSTALKIPAQFSLHSTTVQMQQGWVHKRNKLHGAQAVRTVRPAPLC